MKTTMLSVIGCALLAAATLNARAQSTNGTPIVTLNVNVSLTGVAPSDTPPPARVKIGTKDVIAALATDLAITPSPRARLLAIDDGSGGALAFIIRDGTNDTTIPADKLGVDEAAAVDNTKTSTSGAIGGQRTSINRFVLNTASLSFDVQGYTTQSVSNRGNGHNLLNDTPPMSASSKVNGVANTSDPVLGTISLSGRRIEMVE